MELALIRSVPTTVKRDFFTALCTALVLHPPTPLLLIGGWNLQTVITTYVLNFICTLIRIGVGCVHAVFAAQEGRVMNIQDDKSFYTRQSIQELKRLRSRKWLALMEHREDRGLFARQDRERLLQQIIWIDQTLAAKYDEKGYTK